MISRSLVTGLAAIALAASAVPGRACGFEDPNSAAMQRVMLNRVYPNALYVQGWIDQALREGVLKPAHFTRPGDLFALQRTTRNLRKLASQLADSTPSFSMVLMGPVLWTQFHSDQGGLVAEPHVAGPLSGSVVVVTDVPALAALVRGDISGVTANASGLVRFYGDQGQIEKIQDAIVAAFPGLSGPAQIETAVPSR